MLTVSNKSIRTFVSSILCIILLVTISVSSAAASANGYANNEDFVAHKVDNSLHYSTYEKKVDELKKSGVSAKDAKYYATLDDNILNMEKKDMKLDLTNVEAVSFEEMVGNPEDFKKRILDLDPSALKAGYDAFMTDMSQFKEVEKFLGGNPEYDNYTVQLPTGNVFIFNASPLQSESSKSTEDVKVQAYKEIAILEEYIKIPAYIVPGYVPFPNNTTIYGCGSTWSYMGSVGQFNLGYTNITTTFSRLTPAPPQVTMSGQRLYAQAWGCFSTHRYYTSERSPNIGVEYPAEKMLVVEYKSTNTVYFTPSVPGGTFPTMFVANGGIFGVTSVTRAHNNGLIATLAGAWY